MGPLLRIEPEGILYIKVKLEDCEEIVEKSIISNEVIEHLIYKMKREAIVSKRRFLFMQDKHVLHWNIVDI